MLWFMIIHRMHEEYLGNLMSLIHIGVCCRVLKGSYDGKKLKTLSIGSHMMMCSMLERCDNLVLCYGLRSCIVCMRNIWEI